MAIPDVRVTVWAADKSVCKATDVSGDLNGGHVRYEDTPGGNGAGEIGIGLNYETVYDRGYWTRLNVVEISTGDDTLRTSISSGATKLYVTSTLPYDTAQGEDAQQVYLWNGVTLTMGIPVTGVGSDGGG